MKKHLKKAHFFYYQFVIGLVFFTIYPFVLLFSRSPVNVKGMNFMRHILSDYTSRLSGISFNFNFEKPVDWSKNYIICANHTSNLDISTIILLVKRNFVFLGKHELLENMVTRLYFQTIDIPINRDSKISSYRAFKRAEDYLKSGTNVIIFPEGLIAEKYPPVLSPFKMGPFRLAIEQKISILPVTIADNWKIMWDDGSKFGSRPGASNVYIHPPIETIGFDITDAEQLRDHVFEVINTKLNGTEQSYMKTVNVPGNSLNSDLGRTS